MVAEDERLNKIMKSNTQIREGIQKKSIFLGKSPKLWVGGGQDSLLKSPKLVKMWKYALFKELLRSIFPLCES